MKTLLLLALSVNMASATVITSGSLTSRDQEDHDGIGFRSNTMNLIGEGLNASMGTGGPWALNVGLNQPFCGSAGYACTFNLSTSFSTLDYWMILQTGNRTPTVTIGGVTYTNAALTIAGTIVADPQTAITTCSPCPYVDPTGFFHSGSFHTVWGPFPFTMTGTVTIMGINTYIGALTPVVVAQDTFTGSGFAVVEQSDGEFNEVRTAALTFTPEPSSFAFTGLAALAFAARRRWVK